MRHLLALLTCALLAARILVAPVAARADEAIYLNWSECGPAGPTTVSSSCDDNSGDQRLYVSFQLGQPLDQVVGIEAVIDLQHEDEQIPAWWQLGVGGCRLGALSANGSSLVGDDCVDLWQGKVIPGPGIQGYAVGQPRGGANQARIKVALSLLSADAVSLDNAGLYYAATLVLSNQATTGTGSCAGCGSGACLVLNSIWIKRLPGAPGGDVFLQTPGPGGGNVAVWQATGANCLAVPVRTSSWGSIKTLYR